MLNALGILHMFRFLNHCAWKYHIISFKKIARFGFVPCATTHADSAIWFCGAVDCNYLALREDRTPHGNSAHQEHANQQGLYTTTFYLPCTFHELLLLQVLHYYRRQH